MQNAAVPSSNPPGYLRYRLAVLYVCMHGDIGPLVSAHVPALLRMIGLTWFLSETCQERALACFAGRQHIDSALLVPTDEAFRADRDDPLSLQVTMYSHFPDWLSGQPRMSESFRIRAGLN